MTGIILAGHGDWPDALRHSLEMVYGQTEHLETCPVTNVESAEQISARMDEAMSHMAECDRFVILLDIFGGSPCHAVVPYAMRGDVMAVTGANLAMLIELVNLRDREEWEKLGETLLRTGREAIRDVFAELLQN